MLNQGALGSFVFPPCFAVSQKEILTFILSVCSKIYTVLRSYFFREGFLGVSGALWVLKGSSVALVTLYVSAQFTAQIKFLQ